MPGRTAGGHGHHPTPPPTGVLPSLRASGESSYLSGLPWGWGGAGSRTEMSPAPQAPPPCPPACTPSIFRPYKLSPAVRNQQTPIHPTELGLEVRVLWELLGTGTVLPVSHSSNKLRQEFMSCRVGPGNRPLGWVLPAQWGAGRATFSNVGGTPPSQRCSQELQPPFHSEACPLPEAHRCWSGQQVGLATCGQWSPGTGPSPGWEE